MNTPNAARDQLPFSEFLAWLLAAPVLIAVALPIAFSTIDDARSWTLSNHVLVVEDVVLAVPGLDGAGLDVPRIVVAGMAVVAAVCLIVLAAIHRRSE